MAALDTTMQQRPSALSASLTLAWRALAKLKHAPTQIIDASIWPLMMILMFTFIFGGAVAGSVRQYVQHLIPGMLVLGVAMVSQYAAIGLNTDIQKGIYDRFRSLAFWRPAVIVGALAGNMLRYAIAACVVIGVGMVLGFRAEAGAGGVIASVALALAFAFSLSWVWTAAGLLMDRPESVSMVSSIVNFLLMFVSNVFVQPETMPGFLQHYVKVNPFGITVTAVRAMMHGNATSAQVGYAVLACSVLVAVFAPLTMYLYRNKNAN